MSPPIPSRPRLGSFVRARRHLVDGESRVILHDGRGGRTLALGEREWAILAGMDGTRDLAGLREHAGGRVSLAHLEEFVAGLASHGLLGDAGEGEPDEASDAYARDVPVRPLPDYGFACDGRGGCCRQFPTVLFTPLETARARAAAPDVLDGGQHPARLFAPEHGLDDTLSAVAQIDGRCAFLAKDGGCRIHRAAGEAAKPFGCRGFPVHFVDVGEEIRVAPRVECACVLESLGRASLPPLTEATRGAALPRETYVPALPTVVRMGPDTVSARDFVRWCDALRLPSEREDVAAWCAALATEVQARGLGAKLGESQHTLRPGELAEELEALGGAADRFLRDHAPWRAPGDLVRLGARWLREAAGEARARLVSGREGRVASDPAHERFLVRVAVFTGELAEGSSVEARLRAIGATLLAARAFPDAALGEPAARHPLALVTALGRGHGITAPDRC